MKELYQKIRQIAGKPYGLYKQLSSKKWSFGDFTLEFLHIQGDPYAPPSRIAVSVPMSVLGFNVTLFNSFTRRLALADFLHRELFKAVSERFPKKNASIQIAAPTQEILLRNTLWIENGNLQASFFVALPGERRLIDSEAVADILTSALPDILTSSLYADAKREERAKEAVLNLEMREALQNALQAHNLVAFIPNGSVLPRENGASDKPMPNAIPFQSPKSLQVELVACGKKILGMGIPKGITVITGGAYHGKSTLLQALFKAVYPHVAGDGREWIVIDESALRVGVEEGRHVSHTDISALVRALPGGKETVDFSTENASGSTSEAANLLEAIEFGATTVLIDEDASAVNFLVRDARVRTLVGDLQEPLIPLIDRIQNFSLKGLNFIIVAGACGDYLEVADTVLLLSDYHVECVTEKAKEICTRKEKQGRFDEFNVPSARNFKQFAADILPFVKPSSAVERQVKVKLLGNTLQIGFLTADLSKISGFIDNASRIGAGLILLNMLQNASDELSSTSILSRIEKIQNVGFRGIPQGMTKDAALPRKMEIALALLRLCNR